MKQRLKPLLSPSGASGWRDRLVRSLWDGYARTQRAAATTVAPRPRATPATHAELVAERDRCRRELLDNVLPFWRDHAIDREHGGYRVHLDRQGRVYEDDAKYAAMQGRMIYAFSVGEKLVPGGGYRELAEQGVRFLCDHFWDGLTGGGGWVRTASRAGRPLDTAKFAFDQAYVTIGLCAWLRVAPDDDAVRERIGATVAFLDRLWDETDLGYFEAASPDLGTILRRKTICVELDALAALLDCHEVLGPGSAHAGERVRTLADLIAHRMRDRQHGCVLEHFEADWRYDPFFTRDRIEIGHNLKAAWFLLEAHRRIGDEAHRRAAFELVDFCLRHGWDDAHGGFYQHVFRGGAVWSTEKLWWPQTEGLAVLARMHALTGDGRYLALYRRLVTFVVTALQDPVRGGWIYSAHADGRPRDERKGAHFKAALHETQGWLFAARCFDEMAKTIEQR